MRSFVVAGVVGALLLAPVTADAQPEIRQEKFETYCTPTDPGLDEMSGLTVVDGVLYAVGDSGTDHRLAVLDETCAVTRWLDVPVDPYDVEDLASYDGELWLSDTGDNQARRETVALTRMDPATGQGELHRLVYPDGPRDAETVLIEPDGTPIIVTKELTGISGIYAPEGGSTVKDLASPGPTPLVKLGELRLERTETSGGPPFITGSILATGGAVSLDGSVAAVRTYTDVYLFPVVDGNVATALAGDSTAIALPPQPQGESVAFDGAGNLLVASEAVGGPAAGGPLPPIETLSGAASLVQKPPTTESTDSPSVPRWTFGAMAVAGALVLVSIAYTVRSARRRS